MNTKTLKAALLSLVVTVSGFASAGLITDTSNDSFIDQTTGIEWIDIEVNIGRTRDDVSTDMGLGGAFFGWRFATGDETIALLINAFHPFARSPQTTTEYVNGVIDDASVYWSYIAIMGATTDTWYDINHGDDDVAYVWFYAAYEEIYYNGWNNRAGNWVNDETSWWVVRQKEVPEPSTLAIFALGVIGLVSRRLKKQSPIKTNGQGLKGNINEN